MVLVLGLVAVVAVQRWQCPCPCPCPRVHVLSHRLSWQLFGPPRLKDFYNMWLEPYDSAPPDDRLKVAGAGVGAGATSARKLSLAQGEDNEDDEDSGPTAACEWGCQHNCMSPSTLQRGRLLHPSFRTTLVLP